MSDPERALWAAVVHQAIDDACNWRKQYEVWLASDKAAHKRADAEGISPERRAERAKQRLQRLDEIKHYRNQARAWLLRDRDDFGLVCNLAGLDPAAVRDRIRAVAARQDWQRDSEPPQQTFAGA